MTSPPAAVLVDVVLTELLRQHPSKEEGPKVTPFDVLDVACGPGTAAHILLERASALGVEVVVDASDWSKDMVDTASDRLAGRARRVYQCDAAAMSADVDDSSLDAIVSNFGIFLVPNMKGAMDECARTLRPGGLLALTVWADDDWATSLMCALAALLPNPAMAAAAEQAVKGISSILHPQRMVDAALSVGLQDVVVRRVRTASVVTDARRCVSMFIEVPFLVPVFKSVAQPGESRDAFLNAAAQLLMERAGHREPCVANRESFVITARRPE